MNQKMAFHAPDQRGATGSMIMTESGRVRPRIGVGCVEGLPMIVSKKTQQMMSNVEREYTEDQSMG